MSTNEPLDVLIQECRDAKGCLEACEHFERELREQVGDAARATMRARIRVENAYRELDKAL